MATGVAGKKDRLKILRQYKPYFQDSITLMTKAKKGLKPEALFDFAFISDLDHPKIEGVFNKSMKTFQNYSDRNTALDSGTSEKLLRLFALYTKGAEVFGSVDAFNEWLSKPLLVMGKVAPHTMLDTITGIDLVNEELIRIEYGDLA